MALKEERLEVFLEHLERLVREGGEENFCVFTAKPPAGEEEEQVGGGGEAGGGRFVQAASRRGADAVLLDVPTTSQGLGDAARGTLAELGFEVEAEPWFEVDRSRVDQAPPEVGEVLHEWILAGRDPEDERVPELLARGVLERVEPEERESYEHVVTPQRGAVLVERVFREVLGQGEGFDVEVDLHLQEGPGDDWLG